MLRKLQCWAGWCGMIQYSDATKRFAGEKEALRKTILAQAKASPISNGER